MDDVIYEQPLRQVPSELWMRLGRDVVTTCFALGRRPFLVISKGTSDRVHKYADKGRKFPHLRDQKFGQLVYSIIIRLPDFSQPGSC